MASQRDTGLDDAQVAHLRQTIADGRRPRVRVMGSQFPVATTGTVVRVGDPVRDGADFVMVRIKVGGVSDELGFSPSELSVVGRGRAGAPLAEAGARASTQQTSAPRVRTSRTSQPDQAVVVEAVALPAKRRGGKGTASRSAAATTTTPASPVPTRSKAATAGRRAVSAPAVTITIASAGSSWSVSASRGARAVVKKAPAAPGVVTAIAALLNLQEVEDAVAAVNGAALGEAEARADKLRAELAEIEAVLVSHQPPQ
ncbi:MAG: hypothetical protein QOG22_2365 [Pseudonocardiales bacterium]|nr:hypothetical protein [Pseudonocardiales bacterium]